MSNNSQDTLLASTLNLREAPNGSSFQSSGTLRILSPILHLGLVGIHLMLLAVWRTELEHRWTFSLEHQKIVSFLITAITTGFATVYCAVLVLITQTLSMRRSLHINQTLTSTHDNTAAWAGFGSAFTQLWNQKTISASRFGVISVFAYLGNIAILHITMAGLLSLESFDSTRTVPVITRGLPALDWSNVNSSDSGARYNLWERTLGHAKISLSSLPLVLGSNTTMGLRNGTLYDVPEPNEGIGNITVNATGFNITCRYATEAALISSAYVEDGVWRYKEDNSTMIELQPVAPGLMAASQSIPTWNYTLLYSAIPIVDSNGVFSSSISNFTHLLACSQALVRQTVTLDAKSREFLEVVPSIEKHVSNWSASEPSWIVPSMFPDNLLLVGDLSLVNLWPAFYQLMPQTGVALSFSKNPQLASLADIYLSRTLDLATPHEHFKAPENFSLHDVENILSTIIAAMFWTVGNITPLPQWSGEQTAPDALEDSDGVDIMIFSNGTVDTSEPIRLLQGNNIVSEVQVKARLDLSIVAIGFGLVSSIALAALSLPSLRSHRPAEGGNDIPIHGTGILHTIWLFRNHPELDALLEQIEDPTDRNLREAGMVQTRLAGSGFCGRKSLPSRE